MLNTITTTPPLPLPQIDVTIRPATLADIPFIDGLQKLHTKQVGWMPTKQFEGKINAGHVLVAEEVDSQESIVNSSEGISSLSTINHRLSTPTPLGYCIGNDQYFKRDDVGIIYQMNVVPGKQRGFIGATLLQAQFERSAYGCKLYCCWCAQDIAANKFWEAMGFVPLAFRTGSEKKARTHIFWQKRIRSGDVTTPWWFPSKTAGGSIREDRIVLPIPPGTHWSDIKPMVLPGARQIGESVSRERKAIEGKSVTTRRLADSPKKIEHRQFGPPPATIKPEPIAKVPKPKQPKRKNDPKLVIAARELRDRWLEQVNREPLALSCGKYDVSRLIESEARIERIEPAPMKRLAAA